MDQLQLTPAISKSSFKDLVDSILVLIRTSSSKHWISVIYYHGFTWLYSCRFTRCCTTDMLLTWLVHLMVPWCVHLWTRFVISFTIPLKLEDGSVWTPSLCRNPQKVNFDRGFVNMSSKLICRCDKLNDKRTKRRIFRHEVVINLYVFGTGMEDRIYWCK